MVIEGASPESMALKERIREYLALDTTQATGFHWFVWSTYGPDQGRANPKKWTVRENEIRVGRRRGSLVVYRKNRVIHDRLVMAGSFREYDYARAAGDVFDFVIWLKCDDDFLKKSDEDRQATRRMYFRDAYQVCRDWVVERYGAESLLVDPRDRTELEMRRDLEALDDVNQTELAQKRIERARELLSQIVLPSRRGAASPAVCYMRDTRGILSESVLYSNSFGLHPKFPIYESGQFAWCPAMVFPLVDPAECIAGAPPGLDRVYGVHAVFLRQDPEHQGRWIKDVTLEKPKERAARCRAWRPGSSAVPTRGPWASTARGWRSARVSRPWRRWQRRARRWRCSRVWGSRTSARSRSCVAPGVRTRPAALRRGQRRRRSPTRPPSGRRRRPCTTRATRSSSAARARGQRPCHESGHERRHHEGQTARDGRRQDPGHDAIETLPVCAAEAQRLYNSDDVKRIHSYRHNTRRPSATDLRHTQRAPRFHTTRQMR